VTQVAEGAANSMHILQRLIFLLPISKNETRIYSGDRHRLPSVRTRL
jgi:hypothetical protein